jgi:hypothetical protein
MRRTGTLTFGAVTRAARLQIRRFRATQKGGWEVAL